MIETLASLAAAAGHQLLDIPRRSRMSPAYDGSAGSARSRGWSPTSQGVNDLLFSNLEELRKKSCDLVRRNPWAVNVVESFVSNSVGTGIVPQLKHPDPREKARVQDLWRRWTDEADANGRTDLYGLQSLCCRNQVIGGEAIVRLRYRRYTDGLSVPLQLQVLEGDYLPIYMAAKPDAAGENQVRYGIEFNSWGRRVAYHLYREHPNENTLWFKPAETTRVPARDVMHCYKPLTGTMQRGLPWLTPVMATLYDLERYDSAELIRKKMAAMVVAFEVDVDPASGSPVFGEEQGSDGVMEEGLEPGTYYRLPYGKDVRFNSPSDVGGMYPEFIRFQLRKIAAGAGITYEMLTGDLEKVNFSSIRAGTLEFRRRCEAFQHQVLVFQFCRPVWHAFIETAALAGLIDANAYASNPDLYLNVDWRPQAWPWVDPEADVRAEKEAVRGGFKSRSMVIASTGEDPERVDAEIAAEQKRSDGLKLMFDSDIRHEVKQKEAAQPAKKKE